jgi:hypothetical protein
MDGEFVQVDAFIHLIEVDLARARLEWHGIECYAFDENLIHFNWLYSLAVGGIKLKVRRTDAERAVEILREEPVRVDVVYEAVTGDQGDLVCPQCNSPGIFPERLHRRLVYLSWLFLEFYLGIPLPIITRKWRCMDCRYLWKPR